MLSECSPKKLGGMTKPHCKTFILADPVHISLPNTGVANVVKRSYRKESGETITDKSWLMTNIWDTKRGFMKGLITAPKKLKSVGVKRLMEDALWAQEQPKIYKSLAILLVICPIG
jgi:hypothetical protein